MKTSLGWWTLSLLFFSATYKNGETDRRSSWACTSSGIPVLINPPPLSMHALSQRRNRVSRLWKQTDRLSLIAFKDKISGDPFHVFSSWNDSLHFCKWRGITCGRRHPQRVTSLHLVSLGLVGPISPHIGNLTFLRFFNLSDNSFHGGIPPEIGRLFRLRVLSLSKNQLQGAIPGNLIHCSKIRSISLHQNNLVGKIPVELGSLPKLSVLSLSRNSLIGNIPPTLGNVSSLIRLFLYENNLEGSIPYELGRLANLDTFEVGVNKLSGEIPPSLYNLSSIANLGVSENQLHGNIPTNLGSILPNLEFLNLAANKFRGSLPVSLSNASRLTFIEVSHNDFIGPVPSNLGRLKDLQILNLLLNLLGGRQGEDDLSFLTSLTNCSLLNYLGASMNQFRGELPATIANLSTQLRTLELGDNPISGTIPKAISNLVGLNRIGIFQTLITGTIPIGVGKLKILEGLYFYGNRLSGQIPSSICNATQLAVLNLGANNLEGSIPSRLANCSHLERLVLDGNGLSGTVPREVITIPSLVDVSISDNSLIGNLSLEASDLKQLQTLDASQNKLTGEIPSELSNCVSLVHLNLSSNFLQGSIPPSLNNLKSIEQLDLSHNNLSGHIPVVLQKFSFLQYLDLSYNGLEGEVPNQGVFKNASKVSVLGNNKLCGGIPQLQLPPCPKKAHQKHGRSISLIVVIVSVIGATMLISFVIVILYWGRRKQSMNPFPMSFLEGGYLNLSYGDLFKATEGFSSNNLIGKGSFGSVYKGTFDPNETVMAVKVLNLQQRRAFRSFIAECEALRNIRHRNLVKIVTVCSSIDFQGNDFKALIFDYMPNGSLEKWLHPHLHEQQELRILKLVQRLDIAIDVASALEYLHHHCGRPVIHRDLKPSNVLLDNDMCAHVGDFGLARFLCIGVSDTSQDQTSTIGIKGSIGYIPPEYGMGGKASTHGDVYSYGILLLELFTGKRPTDVVFKDGLCLHQFARMALLDRVMSIVDMQLISEEDKGMNIRDQDGRYNMMNKMQECLSSVIKVGIRCSMESPDERMKTTDIVNEMHAIRKLYLGIGIQVA